MLTMGHEIRGRKRGEITEKSEIWCQAVGRGKECGKLENEYPNKNI